MAQTVFVCDKGHVKYLERLHLRSDHFPFRGLLKHENVLSESRAACTVSLWLQRKLKMNLVLCTLI